jgi:hypothetical protein
MRSLLVLCGLILFVTGEAETQVTLDTFSSKGLYCELPAANWSEALLTGNGEIGAMVMGKPYNDTIIVNHALLYMPINKPLLPVAQGNYLDEIRNLMLQGKYENASNFVVDLSHKEGYGNKRWTDPFVPAFNIEINSHSENILEYRRSVDFETGVVEVKWHDENGTFSRQIFSSRSDSILVMRYVSDKVSNINTVINLSERITPPDWWGPGNGGIERTYVVNDGDYVFFNADFKNRWDRLIHGYDGVAKVINKGGDKKSTPNGIQIVGADEVLVLVKLSPIYDIKTRCIKKLKGDLDKIDEDYFEMLKRHAIIHSKLFNRSSLNLAGNPDDRQLSNEKLILKARKGFNSAFVERAYNATRYHLISGIGINPPNLQGMWGGTMTPPWSSDYTTNGNLPVAVSSLLCSNLPELLLPLFDYLEMHMPEFRINAKRLFECRGIHIPSRLSSHGYNNHFDETWPMTFWTAGAGWYSMLYYDYYLYTQDLEFLKKRALPFMEEALLFYEDFLQLGPDNRYVFNPSYSPENNPSNIASQACINATMDIMVAKQLLRNVMEASLLLNINQDKILRWKSMYAKMPLYEVNSEGYLREWIWPGVEENLNHRHVSHLYGLFDMLDPEIGSQDSLKRGALQVIRKKFDIRKKENGGEMSFGLVHLAFAAATLGESDIVYEILTWLSGNYWLSNLFTTHNPGDLFNFDLTGGYQALIIKMLVYSEPKYISLLHAKSEKIPQGRIKGVSLRGGIKMHELVWNKKEIQVSFSSCTNQSVKVKLPGIIKQCDVKGASFIFEKGTDILKIDFNKTGIVNIKIELK